VTAAEPGTDRGALPQRLSWLAAGTEFLVDAMASCTDAGATTLLPEWSAAHLLAHVDRNAHALANLLSWARTGVPKPMYFTPEERAEGIAQGALLPLETLIHQVTESSAMLDAAMAGLDARHWSARVRSAQGRAITAAEVPWMRNREVWIHAVDLTDSNRFGLIPSDIARALILDVAATVGAKLTTGFTIAFSDLSGDRVRVGPAPGLTVVLPSQRDALCWLTGRGIPTALVAEQGPLPALPSWM
jgi:maleylpyruvate isomerase